jgi:hypothetical protein
MINCNDNDFKDENPSKSLFTQVSRYMIFSGDFNVNFMMSNSKTSLILCQDLLTKKSKSKIMPKSEIPLSFILRTLFNKISN